MGTRADFYVGKGRDAEWLGSIAYDGHRESIDPQILGCQSPEAFRYAVARFLAERDDATLPAQGWPWPWDTSATSDCSYWHFGGQTWDAQGNPEVYVPCSVKEPTDEDDEECEESFLKDRERIEFPDMSAHKNVALGQRSGMLIIGIP